MVLFVHNRYRTTGGEERAVERLLELVRERLGEPAQMLTRESTGLGRGRAAAGLLAGGLAPREVAEAVRLTRARVLHAHNLQPLLGWRALAAARREGARVVLHLHQYRLVCATGVCFTDGAECLRCHGRNTLPGVLHNCRGGRAEAVAYAASLALWQRRIGELADAVIVPSLFARERLRELGAPLAFDRVHVLAPPVALAQPAALCSEGGYALVVSRLSPEKGVDLAIDACAAAGVPLVVAGDGPQAGALRSRARSLEAQGGERGTPAPVRFLGRVDEAELARLRAGAAIAIVPSRSAETFGLAAAEAMAAGLPVIATSVGALPDLVGEEGLVPPEDCAALAAAIGRLWGDGSAGARARERVRMACSPEMIATRLRAVYDG
jgi:glycosyltransferase involved in cell wall biosynthesis